MQEDFTSEVKDNRLSQASYASENLKHKDSFTSVSANALNHHNETETDLSSKSTTKFPPLKKNRPEEVNMNKTNEIITPLDKKVAQTNPKMASSQNSYVVRKFNPKRKT